MQTGYLIRRSCGHQEFVAIRGETTARMKKRMNLESTPCDKCREYYEARNAQQTQDSRSDNTMTQHQNSDSHPAATQPASMAAHPPMHSKEELIALLADYRRYPNVWLKGTRKQAAWARRLLKERKRHIVNHPDPIVDTILQLCPRDMYYGYVALQHFLSNPDASYWIEVREDATADLLYTHLQAELISGD